MFRSTIAVLLFAVMLAGCGDRHRPAVRQREQSPSQAQHPPAHENPHAAQPKQTGQSPEELGNKVQLGTMHLESPESWVRKPPKIGFLLAVFALPGPDEDGDDGRLTVSQVGGSAEENIDRWRSQFGGDPEKEAREELEVAGVTITLVDYTGTYLDQRGPFAPAEKKQDYRMLGAVIPIEGKLYFVKAYGPKQTIATHADTFRDFLESLSSSGSS